MAKQLCLWVLMGALILNVACRKNPVENSAIIEKYFDQCFAAYEAGLALRCERVLFLKMFSFDNNAEVRRWQCLISQCLRFSTSRSGSFAKQGSGTKELHRTS